MKRVKNPAEEYMFTVNPKAKNMDSEKEHVFHTTIS